MAPIQLRPIPPGAYCGPAVVAALTGADLESVIYPAFNRHARADGLLDAVRAVNVATLRCVLEELGFAVRAYRNHEPTRVRVVTWSRRALDRWPGRTLLLTTSGATPHALLLRDGRVHDSLRPLGCPAEAHPFARTIVTWAALVERLVDQDPTRGRT